MILDNDMLTIIVIISLSAMDFWTVKNITGRILVNLRWWSEVDPTGREKWVFESNLD